MHKNYVLSIVWKGVNMNLLEGKHLYIFAVSYTINLGENGEYHCDYMNVYDYMKLTVKDNIRIHEVDIYNYNRSAKNK
jgi:hypothetical protein